MDIFGAIGKLLGFTQDKKKKPQQQQPQQVQRPVASPQAVTAAPLTPQKPKLLQPQVNTGLIHASSLNPQQKLLGQNINPEPTIKANPAPQINLNQGPVKQATDLVSKAVNTIEVPLTAAAGGAAVGADKLFNGGRNTTNLINATNQEVYNKLQHSAVPLNVANGTASPAEFAGQAFKTGAEYAPYFVPAGGALPEAFGAKVTGNIANNTLRNVANSGIKAGTTAAITAPQFAAIDAVTQGADSGFKSFDPNKSINTGLQAGAATLAGNLAGDALRGGKTSLGNAIQRVREGRSSAPANPASMNPATLDTAPTPHQIEALPEQTPTQTIQQRPLQQEPAPTLSGTDSINSRAQILEPQRTQVAQEIPSSNQSRTSTSSIAELPTFDTNKVKYRDKAFRSTRSIIERQGNAGKQLADSLQGARDTQEIYLGQLQKAMPTVTKIARGKAIGKNSWNNKDYENFVDATQGLAAPKNPTIAKAVEEWQSVHPQIRQRAVDAGLDVGDLGPNYYPHFINYDEVFKNKNTYNQAINHLVQTGQAKTPEEAIQLLGYARDTSRNREFGNLEASRLIDLPNYDKTPNSLINYLNGSTKRIAHTETFGAKDENALKLINKIGLEGGDTEAAKNAFDIAVGARKYNPTSEKISGSIRKYLTTTRLGLGALTNVSQNVNTGIVTGHLRTMGAMLKQLDPKTRSFVGDTGVISDALLNDLKTQYGYESFANKVLGKAVNKVTAPFFGSVERFNRAVSATAGRDYALRLAQKGDESTLRKLGVTGDIQGKTLSEAQQIQAARKIVEKTQFKVDPQDLPGWADSPGGKLVSQFRTFSYAQGKFVSNEILKPAAKGNLVPLARLLASLPLGYALYETRRAIDGRPEETDKTKVALQTWSKVGGGGLAFDIYQGLNPINSQYLPSDRRVTMAVGALGGPAAGQAAGAVGSLSEAIQAKNTPDDLSRLDGKVAIPSSDGSKYNDLTSLTRFGLQQVPIVGTATANRVLPYKKISEADTGTSDGSTSISGAVSKLNKQERQQTADLKKAVGADTYAISTLNNTEKQQLIDAGVLTQDQIDQAESTVSNKRVEMGLSSAKASTYADKYKAAQKEFNSQSSKWSAVEKAKKQKALDLLTVQKDYNNDTVDLYNMSKQDVYDLVSKDPDGNKKVQDILAYGDALVNAGVDKTNKYRDKYGNLKLDDGSKKSGGSKKGGKKGRKSSFKVPKTSFNRVGSTSAIRKLLQSTGTKLKEKS